jgi:hypothetical protein
MESVCREERGTAERRENKVGGGCAGRLDCGEGSGGEQLLCTSCTVEGNPPRSYSEPGTLIKGIIVRQEDNKETVEIGKREVRRRGCLLYFSKF